MDLSQLATKQKRIKNWSDFIAEGGVQDPELRSLMEKTIQEFKLVLARCWQAKGATPEDQTAILDCERKLEEFDERARMTVVGKKAGAPERGVW